MWCVPPGLRVSTVLGRNRASSAPALEPKTMFLAGKHAERALDNVPFGNGARVHLGNTVAEAIGAVINLRNAAHALPVLAILSEADESYLEWAQLITAFKARLSTAFVICASSEPLDALLRYALAGAGASMISSEIEEIAGALQQVQSQRPGSFPCVYCNLRLDEDSLWLHNPLYHVNERNIRILSCPICSCPCDPQREPYPVHLRNAHGPCARGVVRSEYSHRTDKLYSFSLVVCIRKVDDKTQMLLVQEFASSGFWLPGGRVDPGEDLIEAAERECMEEAGCDIRLTGVLQFQYSPSRRGHVRLRVIFLAELSEESPNPKTIPDYESMGALWVDLDTIEALHSQRMLRGSEPLHWAKHLKNGGAIYDLGILGAETA